MFSAFVSVVEHYTICFLKWPTHFWLIQIFMFTYFEEPDLSSLVNQKAIKMTVWSDLLNSFGSSRAPKKTILLLGTYAAQYNFCLVLGLTNRGEL